MMTRSTVPFDGEGLPDLSFLDDAGIPQELSDQFKALTAELDQAITGHADAVHNAQQSIALLLGWVTVAGKLVDVLQGLVPLLAQQGKPGEAAQLSSLIAKLRGCITGDGVSADCLLGVLNGLLA